LTIKNTKTKIPAFKVPIYKGDTLDGDEYIWMVKMTFKSNVMSQFLEDPNHYDNSPYWSGAFASRLRESIEESNILLFIDMELDGKTPVPGCGTELKSTCRLLTSRRYVS